MLTGNPEHDLETVRALEVLGVVARADDGELCFYSEPDGDGVPVIDNAPTLETAMLEATPRWVPSETVEQVLATGMDVIVPHA